MTSATGSEATGRIPRTIGRYAVVELLGTGAFSAVYRAVDERVGGDVAIKLLADHHSLDPDIRERFIAEARLLRRVSDPHVVRLYELDETERHQPYLVLEFVGGGNLATRREAMAAAGRTVGVGDISRIVANVATALTALHDQRIIHRDLSPRNLLVRSIAGGNDRAGGLLADGDELVLADLGLSKDLAASSGLTAAAGTDGFAAPEQRQAGVVDERADVYAASALLTWLALGRRPGASNVADLTAAGWPEAFGRLLERGLDANPERRPPSIAAWRDGVEAALEPPTPAPAAAVRSRRRLVTTAAAAAIAAAGLTYGALQLAGSDNNPVGDTNIENLGAGMIRAERTVGDTTSAFEGPETMTVGETAIFNADTGDAVSWIWLDQRGGSLAGESELTLRPSSAGSYTLHLATVGPGGETSVATATLTVVGPPPATDAPADTTTE